MPNTNGVVHLLNGTFNRSDGVVARDRFRDVSLVANGSPFERSGNWYVKLIQMTRLADATLNYESKWATLTFAIRN